MAALREIAAHFGIKFDTKALDKGNKSISSTAAGLTKLAGVAAAAFAGGQLVRGFMRLSEEADQLVKTADNIGASAESLQAWQHVAGRAGVGAEVMNNAFRKASQSLLLAEQGSKQAVDAFDMIGVSVDELAGKSPEDQLLAIGVALSKVEDISKRNAIAMQLLGKRGSIMNKMFKDPALQEQLEHYAALAPVTTEQARNFEMMNDALGDVQLLMKRVAFTLANTIAPAVTWVSLKFKQLSQDTYVFEAIATGIGLVATALTVQMAPALLRTAALFLIANAPMIAWIALAALIGLAIEDLISWFNGGESVIGAALEAMFGEHAKGIIQTFMDMLLSPVDTAMQLWEDLKFIFGEIKEAIMGPLNEAGAAIGGFLRDNPLVKKILLGGAGLIVPGTGGQVAGGTSGGSTNNLSPTNNVSVTVNGGGDPAAISTAVTNGVNNANSGMGASLAALTSRP